jgi:sulfur relay (sulfurtransferase) complex TusBCD TusD component (DsrE family)
LFNLAKGYFFIMKTWVRKTLSVGVLAAGALLFAPAAAQAEISQISVGNEGVLNGNQAAVPIQVPVNVCGNGVGAVIGVGVGVSGICANGAAHDINDDDRNGKGKHKYKESSRTEGATQFSWDNDGVLNGNQAYVPVQIPVNVCGNGVGAVIGVGVGLSGACVNGAAHDVEESSRTEGALQFSGDNDGVLNGNQIYVPIQVPINICGNGVGVLGVGAGISGACFNGAAHDVEESKRTEGLAQVSGDNDGVLNGNQIAVPIQVPINVCGNGVGVLGAGIGVSGACVNGAAWDVNDDDDNGNGHHHYKKNKKDQAASEESLPLVGDLTGGLSSLPLSGASSVPVAGDLGSGVKTSKVNVGGVDPMALLSQVPTA